MSNTTPTKPSSITIRSWPKIIFLYPVMLTSFICGVWEVVTHEDQESEKVAGMIFLFILCLNLLVISFDFNRFRTMALAFFMLAMFFLLLYLSNSIPVLDKIRAFLGDLEISASPQFYFALGIYLLGVFVAVYFNSRFNYWVIKSNEILHKEGFLGDVRRFPSPNLRMTKEIKDVFEFLLLGAGRIVLNPASEKESIVLEHVLRVNLAEKAIQDLLSRIQVSAEFHDDDEASAGAGVGG
jgi:hypothetical protein